LTIEKWKAEQQLLFDNSHCHFLPLYPQGEVRICEQPSDYSLAWIAQNTEYEQACESLFNKMDGEFDPGSG
jgi:hypothetical protein